MSSKEMRFRLRGQDHKEALTLDELCHILGFALSIKMTELD